MEDMIKGNHAFAEAAIRAGATFYAGYPITPSSEIMEYLSVRLPEIGGVFIQAESEGASMNILTGASASGVRCFTASSSVGMTLKQEGISHMADSYLPFLAINVVRYGTGLGTLDTGQSDYLRDTRGGGSGDYRTFVLAIDEKAKYDSIKENEQMWAEESLEDAEYVIVAYGLAGRSATGAVKQLRNEGYKVGLIRPITLWPFPEKAFDKVNKDVKGYISVEENATGQMVEDIALTLKKTIQSSKPVYMFANAFGIPTMKKIKADFISVRNGEIKEVY